MTVGFAGNRGNLCDGPFPRYGLGVGGKSVRLVGSFWQF